MKTGKPMINPSKPLAPAAFMINDAIKAAKGKMNTMNNKAEIARNMPFSCLCVCKKHHKHRYTDKID